MNNSRKIFTLLLAAALVFTMIIANAEYIIIAGTDLESVYDEMVISHQFKDLVGKCL